jgi:putative transposase
MPPARAPLEVIQIDHTKIDVIIVDPPTQLPIGRPLECVWPMHGKPPRIYVDNGAEFHSEGLGRGCEVHGVKLDPAS